MAKLNIGNVILCEHAVQGAHNKNTLVNVYAGDIIVGSMPADLNFGLYIEFLEGERPEEIILEIALGGKKALTAEGIVRKSTTNTGPGLLMLPLVTMRIAAGLEMDVFVSAPGFKKQRILRKKIYQGSIPN